MRITLRDAWLSVADQKAPRFCPEDPLRWVEPYTGCPLWIDKLEGAWWAKCETSCTVAGRRVSGIPGPPVPSRFPRLERIDGAPEHHGYGRPRRAERNRRLVLFVAWARDVAGLTETAVAELLYASPDEHISSTETKRVARAAKDGRLLYRSEGVLPWAAFGDARLPREWWREDAFREAVRAWQAEALVRREHAHEGVAYEPQPDPGRKREEMFAEMFRPISEQFASLLNSIRLPNLSSMPRISFDPAAIRDGILRSRGVEPWSFDASIPSGQLRDSQHPGGAVESGS
jgi:hypothetical protein